MTKSAVDIGMFEDIFQSPSIRRMLAMEWSDFEDYVQYVFECAGYRAENVDPERDMQFVALRLRQGSGSGKVVAVVEILRYATAHISREAVLRFAGDLRFQGDVPGFMITTSEFTETAYDAARATQGQVKLINGDRFLRYIRYVHGTRLAREDLEFSGLKQPIISPNILFEADSINRRPSAITTVLAIGNNKGGVAKTRADFLYS